MGFSKNKLRLVLLILLFSKTFCYSDEKIDSMVGIWIDHKSPTEFFVMDKINDEKYYVCYVDYYDNHLLDFSGVATVVDEERLYIKVSKDEFFYIFLDFKEDSIWVLWNHDYILEMDSWLTRANYIYDENLQRQLEEEREKRYWESLINEVKEMQKNKDLYGE